jgi:hypothetical protein
MRRALSLSCDKQEGDNMRKIDLPVIIVLMIVFFTLFTLLSTDTINNKPRFLNLICKATFKIGGDLSFCQNGRAM